jgi:hypothetical protein
MVCGMGGVDGQMDEQGDRQIGDSKWVAGLVNGYVGKWVGGWAQHGLCNHISPVGMETCYGLGRLRGRSSSPGKGKIFLFLHVPIRWEPELLHPAVKRTGVKLTT